MYSFLLRAKEEFILEICSFPDRDKAVAHYTNEYLPADTDIDMITGLVAPNCQTQADNLSQNSNQTQEMIDQEMTELTNIIQEGVNFLLKFIPPAHLLTQRGIEAWERQKRAEAKLISNLKAVESKQAIYHDH